MYKYSLAKKMYDSKMNDILLINTASLSGHTQLLNMNDKVYFYLYLQ